MKFYNRETELEMLRQVAQKAQDSAQMTFIMGRRRIGKTTLILKAYCDNFVYLFVSRKSESLLCQEFINQIEASLHIKILGEFTLFSKLFEYLIELSKTRCLTLILDEFQEFFTINPSIYADIQNLWDRNKGQSKMNLILSGSIYSLMYTIFENAKQPLYGRANYKMMLKPFNIHTLNEIFTDAQVSDPKAMLAFYAITGGVAKYVEILVDHQAYTLEAILDVYFRHSSLFVQEGKDLLIEEFGKDYTVYFSILSLIASSKTSRPEIESILGKSVGGYLERLEQDYNLIKSIKPLFSKPQGRLQKYAIEDNFLNFWFRFVYKYQSAIEIENYDYVKSIIKADFDTFSGKLLEKYFMEKLRLSKQFNLIGHYWERGNLNEIDLVAINEREKLALIGEVKLASKKIKLKELTNKSQKLINLLPGYQINYRGFSLQDIVETDTNFLSGFGG